MSFIGMLAIGTAVYLLGCIWFPFIFPTSKEEDQNS